MRIDQEKAKKFLGSAVKEIQNCQLDEVLGSFYSLAACFIKWYEKRVLKGKFDGKSKSQRNRTDSR